MERRIGTVSRGLRGPIIKEGDDLRKIVVDTLMGCLEAGDFEIGSKDVLSDKVFMYDRENNRLFEPKAPERSGSERGER